MSRKKTETGATGLTHKDIKKFGCAKGCERCRVLRQIDDVLAGHLAGIAVRGDLSVGNWGDYQKLLSLVTETYRLTSREADVMALMADGKTNKEIAADLDLTVHTIHTHVRRILKKTGRERRAEIPALILSHLRKAQ